MIYDLLYYLCLALYFSNKIFIFFLQNATMKILPLILLLPFKLFAQDITGVWTGFLQTAGSEVPYELAISESKDKLSGYSLTIFTFNGIENTGIKSMKFKNNKGTLTIEDDEMIYNNYCMIVIILILIIGGCL